MIIVNLLNSFHLLSKKLLKEKLKLIKSPSSTKLNIYRRRLLDFFFFFLLRFLVLQQRFM